MKRRKMPKHPDMAQIPKESEKIQLRISIVVLSLYNLAEIQLSRKLITVMII
jgi:hypothetical protein